MKARGALALEIALLTVLYIVTGRLGLRLSAVSGFAALVWAPSGIALAMLLPRLARWPGAAIGAVVVNAWVGAPLHVAVLIGIGNTLEAVVAVIVLRHLDFRPSLERLRDVVALAIVAAGACVISATIGVGSLGLAERGVAEGVPMTWLAWWWGDFAGILVVTPIVLTWHARDASTARRTIERIAVAASLTVLTIVIFYGPVIASLRAVPRPNMLYPLLMWAAIRFGPRGAARAIFLICAVSISAAAIKFAPLALADVLLELQSFVTISAIATLGLAASTSERTSARHELERSKDQLEQRVRDRVVELERINLDLARRQEQLAEAQALASIGSFEWDLERQRLSWSDELYRLYGLAPGTPIDVAGFFERIVPEDRAAARAIVERSLADLQPFSLDERIMRSDGSVRQLTTRAKVESRSGRAVRVHGTCQDITDRKAVESKLTASLLEKEVLLREIHHRVKNNLQVIMSMLALQSRTVLNPEVRQVFEESWSRILSMALVHELLYQSKEFASIEFDEYLRQLTSRIAQSYGVTNGRIDVRVNVRNVRLDIDTSVPCGLIANELVSNAFKHAFPGGRHGHVVVSLRQEPGGPFLLEVQDDGIGISEAARAENVQSLGLQIVRALTKQLHGTVDIRADRGTTFRIAFPSPA